MSAEIHLFILWEKVGSATESLLRRIRSDFEVLGVYRIQWTPALFSANLSRFYGQSLPPGCNKEESCGVGPFTLVVVRDEQPVYAVRQTTHGPARVNVGVFDLKTYYRSREGGGLPIHATNTVSETRRDLMLLLGASLKQYSTSASEGWNGEVLYLRRDIVGAQSWEDISALFAALNETVRYVVLRNFEHLPGRFNLESHGDVDLLVDDFAEAILVANATPVFREYGRVHHNVVVAGKRIPFDFRFVGDGYYDENWQRRILDTRVKMDGFYVPDKENHFYSLLYHTAVHKREIAPDYVALLSSAAESLGVQISEIGPFDSPKAVRKCLAGYMKSCGYRFSRPQDRSVYFNADFAFGQLAGTLDRLWSRTSWKKRAQTAVRPRTLDAEDTWDESLNHPARANLLMPFQFCSEQRVLEFGSGAGVITRFLGESGAHVVALESNPRLAAAVEERCRDLPNVKVVCDDPLKAELNGRFDVITFIGSAKQIAMSDYESDPFDGFLAKAISLLTPEGVLIVAMDNQLGLKCFNGCGEEHSAIPYFGINDLYVHGAPATYGRRVLSEILGRHGFPVQTFYYPFPDYKVPGVILSAAALREKRLNVADLLIHQTGRDYPETFRRAFAENMAWRVASENGLLPDLANSFLVFARRAGASQEPTKWLAKMYNRGQRRLCYQMESTLEEDRTGSLVVRKRKLHPEAHADGSWARHIEKDSNYVEGSLLIAKIHRAMAGEVGIEELACGFTPWVEHLVAAAVRNGDGKLVLPGEYADCIPANLVQDDAGKLHYFDAEWDCEAPISLAWVLIRGVHDSLTGCMENRKLSDMTFREMAKRIVNRSGVELSDADFSEADSQEARLSSQCFEKSYGKDIFAEILDRPLAMISRYVLPAREDLFALEHAENEIRRMKSTVSWQITKPLRLIANLPRLIRDVVNSG